MMTESYYFGDSGSLLYKESTGKMLSRKRIHPEANKGERLKKHFLNLSVCKQKRGYISHCNPNENLFWRQQGGKAPRSPVRHRKVLSRRGKGKLVLTIEVREKRFFATLTLNRLRRKGR